MDRIEKINKSLEEEIDRFEDWMETYNQSDYPTSFTTRDIARHFAEWQKSQMLKDAVEGEVYKFGEVAYVKERNNAELTKYLSQFNNGDKVRIVVLKEEE